MECDAWFHEPRCAGQVLSTSQCRRAGKHHDWIPQEGFNSIARARGYRRERFGTDLVAFKSKLWQALKLPGSKPSTISLIHGRYSSRKSSRCGTPTVGFLRKAWIKLKSLFDDDVNVEVEMAKIDKELEQPTKLKKIKATTIADRMKRRDATQATDRIQPCANAGRD